MRLHPDFNTHAFGHCIIFFGVTRPRSHKSEGARFYHCSQPSLFRKFDCAATFIIWICALLEGQTRISQTIKHCL